MLSPPEMQYIKGNYRPGGLSCVALSIGGTGETIVIFVFNRNSL
jgi:hypothetical protein